MNGEVSVGRRRQRDQWDSTAQSMPDLSQAASTEYYRRCEIALVERSFGQLSGKRVLKLDLWNEAVNTRILNWMKAQGAHAVGVDVSFTTTSRAQANGRNNGGPLHVLQADIRELPFQAGSFDLLYTMGTIEHVDEYREAVAEICRVLRPGGRAIIGVPHKWDPFLRPALVWLLERAGWYPYAPERSFGFRELRGVAEAAGLRVTGREGILAFPGVIRMADVFLLRRNNRLRKLTPYFLWPFGALEPRWRWTRRFGYLLVVVVEKP